jgi:hypothetical protein
MTTQKIVSLLVKLSDDKKASIAKRCDEYSVWLAGELKLVEKLILNNPRNALSDPTSRVINPATENNTDDTFQKTKRKSPDACDFSASNVR